MQLEELTKLIIASAKLKSFMSLLASLLHSNHTKLAFDVFLCSSCFPHYKWYEINLPL